MLSLSVAAEVLGRLIWKANRASFPGTQLNLANAFSETPALEAMDQTADWQFLPLMSLSSIYSWVMLSGYPCNNYYWAVIGDATNGAQVYDAGDQYVHS